MRFVNASRRSVLKAVSAGLTLVTIPVAASPFDRSRIKRSGVAVRRGFADVEYGQLHYRMAVPKSADNATKRPIVCLHQTPNSSQVFVEFMAEVARDRAVYAVDIPGLGESDLPLSPPEIADYAHAMQGFLDALDLQEVDIVGYHTGASIAAELANAIPARISRMMLVGLALLNEEERSAFFEQPWPEPTEEDGSHLMRSWRRSFRWRGAGQSDASVERTFIQKTAAGQTAWWAARAVMRHDLAAALRLLEVPFFAVNPRDDLYDVTSRLRRVRPEVKIVDRGQYGFGIFEVAPADMSALATTFFDEGEV